MQPSSAGLRHTTFSIPWSVQIVIRSTATQDRGDTDERPIAYVFLPVRVHTETHFSRDVQQYLEVLDVLSSYCPDISSEGPLSPHLQTGRCHLPLIWRPQPDTAFYALSFIYFADSILRTTFKHLLVRVPSSVEFSVESKKGCPIIVQG